MNGYAKCCNEPESGLCALCDTLYCVHHASEHRHPEPQSGEFRDAWLRSGLPYLEWTCRTPEGARWDEMRRAAE